MKVMTRLQNITYLQSLLERTLAGVYSVYLNNNTSGSQNLPIMLCVPVETFNMKYFVKMCVSGTPGYVPPVANFDGESTDAIILSSAAPVNKAKKGNHTL